MGIIVSWVPMERLFLIVLRVTRALRHEAAVPYAKTNGVYAATFCHDRGHKLTVRSRPQMSHRQGLRAMAAVHDAATFRLQPMRTPRRLTLDGRQPAVFTL